MAVAPVLGHEDGRRERLRQRRDDPLDDLQPRRVRGPRVEGDVDGAALGALAAAVLDEAGAREQGRARSRGSTPSAPAGRPRRWPPRRPRGARRCPRRAPDGRRRAPARIASASRCRCRSRSAGPRIAWWSPPPGWKAWPTSPARIRSIAWTVPPATRGRRVVHAVEGRRVRSSNPRTRRGRLRVVRQHAAPADVGRVVDRRSSASVARRGAGSRVAPSSRSRSIPGPNRRGVNGCGVAEVVVERGRARRRRAARRATARDCGSGGGPEHGACDSRPEEPRCAMRALAVRSRGAGAADGATWHAVSADPRAVARQESRACDRPVSATSRDQARDTILRDGSAIRVRRRARRRARAPRLPAGPRRRVASASGSRRSAPTCRDPRPPLGRSRATGRLLARRRDGTGPTDGGIIGNGSYDRLGPRLGRGRVRRRRRAPGPRRRDAAARGARAARAGGRHRRRSSRRSCPRTSEMLEVFRASGFPLRLHAEPGAMIGRVPHRAHRTRRASASSAASRPLRRPRSARCSTRASVAVDRRVAAAWHARRRAVPQPAHGRLRGAGLPGEPQRGRRAVGGAPTGRSPDIPGPVDLAVIVVPADAAIDGRPRHAPRRASGRSSSCRAGSPRPGPRARRASASWSRSAAQAGHAPGGPELHGRASTSSRTSASTRRSRRRCRPRGGSASSRRAARSGWRSSSTRTGCGLGLSSFISIGNKADLSGNDFLQYWEDGPGLLGHRPVPRVARQPAQVRRASRAGSAGRKPIIAVKSGRSAAGARATSSHTGALLGASDVTVDALFHQAGVVRTDTLGEFFDVAALLANQPLPAGRRVGDPDQRRRSRDPRGGRVRGGRPRRAAHPRRGRGGAGGLPPAGGRPRQPGRHDRRRRRRPSAGRSRRSRRGTGSTRSSSSSSRRSGRAPEDVAAAIRDAVAGLPRPIPVLAVFMAADGGPAALQRDARARPRLSATPRRPPVRSPTRPRYAEWRAAPPGASRRSRTCARTRHRGDRGALARPAERPMARRRPAAGGRSPGRRWGRRRGRADRLARARRGGCPARLLRDPDRRRGAWPDTPGRPGHAAEALGGPSRSRPCAPGVVHKAEARRRRALARRARARSPSAAGEMRGTLAAPGTRSSGSSSSAMVPGGVEMLVGVVHDRLFGPVIACGARRHGGRSC